MQAQQGMEEQDVWEGPGEHNMEEAQALIEKALARVGLITVLTRRLESHGDLLARNSEMIPTGEHSPGGLFDITGEGEKIIEKGGKRWGRYISKELHYQQCFQQHFNLIRESQPLATRLTSCAHASDIPISISSENRGPLRLLPP